MADIEIPSVEALQQVTFSGSCKPTTRTNNLMNVDLTDRARALELCKGRAFLLQKWF